MLLEDLTQQVPCISTPCSGESSVVCWVGRWDLELPSREALSGFSSSVRHFDPSTEMLKVAVPIV